MSKSKGNAMSPLELAKTFTVDGYRHFFLSDVQFGADGSISLERMVQVYNASLANSWGNLCSRALNMTTKYCNGRVPVIDPQKIATLNAQMGNPLAEAANIYGRYIAAMGELDYSTALATVMEFVDAANLYVEKTAPWSLAKAVSQAASAAAVTSDSADTASIEPKDRLNFVLYNILEAIRIMALFFYPVMPNSSAEVWRRLGLDELSEEAITSKWSAQESFVSPLEACAKWGGLLGGSAIEVGEPLFPRLDIDSLDL
jgi:methionyl-tRNA synthetase